MPFLSSFLTKTNCHSKSFKNSLFTFTLCLISMSLHISSSDNKFNWYGMIKGSFLTVYLRITVALGMGVRPQTHLGGHQIFARKVCHCDDIS